MANDYPALTPVQKSDIDKLAIRDAKLNALADAIDAIEVLDDGSLYLKTKNHLIIESSGNQIMYSSGDIVLKSQLLHLNPTTPINDSRDGEEYVKRVRVDAADFNTTEIASCDKCGNNQEEISE